MIKKIVQIGLRTYKPKYRDGDKVVGNSLLFYIEGIDEGMTYKTGALHYLLGDIKYAHGKSKEDHSTSMNEADLQFAK